MEITVNQAIVAHQEGRLEEAERLYRSILENQPTNLIIRNNLGILLFNLGKYNEAEASYKKAIELKPDYALSHNNLGSILKKLDRLTEAEASYRKAIELKPDYADAHYNLGITLQTLKQLDGAEASYRKAIELKPNYTDAHCNLGAVLQDLDKLDEAETSYRKAIELKPDYELAHNNLGATLKELDRLDEAEASYRKAIEFKPDYVDAYNNLGLVLQDLDKFDEAETSYRKAIKLEPDYEDATLNLDILRRQKDLLVNIFRKRKSMKKDKIEGINFSVGLTSNPFITHRSVEKKFFKDLYKGKLKELDKTHKIDARFGNGKCSDFNLFKSDFSIIKKIEKDLINIMKEAVKSDICIFDSFLNIYKAGGGTAPHIHIGNFDKTQGLVNQKYSLTYYLSIGDQNCSEPGVLKLQDPNKEILPSEGMIVIFPASRKHSAVYNGEKDRVMIGVNFYSLI